MHTLSTLNAGRRAVTLVLLTVLLQGSVAQIPVTASPSTGGARHAAPRSDLRRIAARPLRLLPVVDQTDILPRHRLLADRTLRTVPSLCRRSLKNFYVRYAANDRRGYGGKSTIVLDGTVPDSEFVALLVHECGHVIHANLTGTPGEPLSEFRDGTEVFTANATIVSFFRISWEQENVLRAGTELSDFASGYGRSDAFEDFAEFLVAYVLHRPVLTARARENSAIAAKLQWTESQLPLLAERIAKSEATWTGRVPWDATKMPMTLVTPANTLAASIR